MPTPDIRRNIEARLEELHAVCLPELPGSVDRYYASGLGYYPPSEAGPERDAFAIAIATVDGELYGAGDRERLFPLHSISKVFTYGLALVDHGPERVLERVGVEPSGDAFNSVRLDERNMRPFNPMVNAGALVTNDLVRGADPAERAERTLATLRAYAGHDGLAVDPDTFEAELRTADRNRGTGYLMRSAGMLQGDVEEVLRLYLGQCSVLVTADDLAVMAATLAAGGVNPLTGTRALPRRRVRDVVSVIHTCGMYDYAGSWAFEIGVPAKSGVSGGIMAVVPGKMGLGVCSPGLDVYGNSVRGMKVCKVISENLGLHVFATEDEDEMLAPGDEGKPLRVSGGG